MQLRQQSARGAASRTPPPPTILVFGSPQSDSLQTDLFTYLEEHSLPYDLQIDLIRLSSVAADPSPNQFALLLTNIYSEDDIKAALKDKSKTNSLRTYPYPAPSLGFPNFSTPKEVLEACEQLKRGARRGGSIRLSGVHSINRSYSSSKSITKVSSESHYQSLYYYRNNDYGSNDSPLYQQVIDILSKDSAYHPFLDISSTLKQIQGKQDKKALLVCPTRLAEEVTKALKKKEKEEVIDLLLIGPLKSNKYMLNPSVVLATESPTRVYEYLKAKNMVSPHIVSVLFEQLIRNHKADKTVQQEYTGYGPDNTQEVHPVVTDFFDKIAHPPVPSDKADKGQENKHKIRKIKSPTKSRPNEVKANTVQSSLTTSHKQIDIHVSEPQDQPIIETEEFHTNKQGERLVKSRSQGEIGSPVDISYPPPAVTPHYSTAHTIRSKFRNPSTVIHETSDEYRGSNKESIVNLEPELVEKATRVVRKEETTQPEQVRIQSEQVIETTRPQWHQNLPNQSQRNAYYNSFTKNKPQNQSQTHVQTINSRWYPEGTNSSTSKTETHQAEHITSTHTPITRTYGNFNRPEQNFNKYEPQSYQEREVRTYGATRYASPTKIGQRSAYESNGANRTNGDTNSNSRTTVQGASSSTGTPVVKYNSTNYNLEGYERVEVNGITMYKKKQDPSQSQNRQNPAQTTNSGGKATMVSSNYSPRPSYGGGTVTEALNRDSSPRVLRYEVSPRREIQTSSRQVFSRDTYQPDNGYMGRKPFSNGVSSGNYYN